MSSEDIAISVNNIGKTFKLPKERHSGLKQLIINAVHGKHERGYVKQQVLKDISFDIKKGDFFGIVGRNGSGKSTLLKLLAGIYEPGNGEIKINGSLVPFIELGVGFNPELTGRENVFLNGALLGFDRKKIERLYDSIVEFAELSDFMDQKLKNYSSGMQVRLAFSIAIQADADILILDEVLAVGDEDFQRKCYEYFAKLKRNKKTVILVTHDMESAQKFCNKAIMIEKGKIVERGDPAKVAQKYRDLFLREEDKTQQSIGSLTTNKNVDAKIDFERKDGKFIFDITVNPKTNLDNAAVVFLINSSTGERVYRWATDLNDIGSTDLSKDFKLHLELQDVFPISDFYAGLSIVSKDRTKDYAIFHNLIEFNKPLPPFGHRFDIHWKPGEQYQIGNK